MNRTTLSCIAALAIAAISTGHSFAQSRDTHSIQVASVQACTDLTNHMSAAYDAHDWRALNRISSRYIKQCDIPLIVHHDLSISDAYSSIAAAQRELGNFHKALAASNACKERFFSNALCHFEEALALAELKRRSEAQTSFIATQRIAMANLENNKRTLRSNLSPDEQADLEAQNKLLEAIIDGPNAWLTRLVN